MKINIDEQWCLDCDTDCVQLLFKVITGAGPKSKPTKEENIGKVRYDQHGYYGTVEQALKAYLTKKVGSIGGEITANELITMWAKCCEHIKECVKGLPVKGIK